MIPRLTALAAALTGAAVFISATLSPARAEAPLALSLPVDCTLGETCFIQQYVDRDPGPEARDFTCGGLSYDGHRGTDFRVADRAAMREGVAVLAAAPGTVRGVRNTAPDTGRAGMTEGEECGNGVAITHGDGWETQYCHLAQGSVTVVPGDAVETGQPLGLIGYSGNTEFPHLHLSVRRDGATVDPFDPSDTATCGAGAAPLWPLDFDTGGLLTTGFSGAIPDYEAIQNGTAHESRLQGDGEALVLWAFLYNGRAGDLLRFRIATEDGRLVHEAEIALDRSQAQLFRASGRRTPPEAWPAGPYVGEIELVRGGAVIDRATTSAIVD